MLQEGFSAGYVDSANGPVHYLEHGDGRPILMLHQGGSSSREFVSIARRLDGWRAVMPDIPDHGNSAECDEPSIERYAASIRDLVDALGISRLVLFGHHFGGVVAAELAVLLGSRVEHLIISNTPYVDEHARGLRKGEAPRSYVATRDDGSHLTELWASRMALYGGDAALSNRFIAENLLLGERVERAHAAVAAYRMEDRFPEYAGGLTFIHGAADPYISIEIEHALDRYGPDRLVTLPRGGVALIDQCGDDVAAVIRETAR